jgi:hypothetical protein
MADKSVRRSTVVTIVDWKTAHAHYRADTPALPKDLQYDIQKFQFEGMSLVASCNTLVVHAHKWC